jgi:predicted RNA-binding protein YlqC (UPF0109 family)
MSAISVLALELQKMLELRIENAQMERNVLKEELDAIDNKLRKAIGAIGKRPLQTEQELNELARSKEFQHSTTSMSLMKEKEFLRELETIKLKKKELIEYNKKQSEIELIKSHRLQFSSDLKEKEEMLDELYNGSRKLNVSNVLQCNPTDVVEKKISVPDDNMSRIIGKGGSSIKALEELYAVIIYSERANVLRIMGLEHNVSTAYNAIVIKANAVTETITLPPALKACLFIDKANITKSIQEKYDVKLNFNKNDCICKIYGQAAGVASAKEEVLAVEYSKFKIKVDPSVIPKLVGKYSSLTSIVIISTYVDGSALELTIIVIR